MSKITNLINKEEDILSSIDENKYLEKEVEIQHEHLEPFLELREVGFPFRDHRWYLPHLASYQS